MRYMSRALTERESQVAALVAEGYRDREIAEALGVGVRTVHTYLNRAFLKASVGSRRDLAVWWTKQAPEQEAVS